MPYKEQKLAELGHRPALAVLADPTRQAILEQLRAQPLAVGEIAQNLEVSHSAVSQHLKALRLAKLVREHREGTRHYYSLDPDGFAVLRHYVDSMWLEALNSFAAFVAEQQKKTEVRTRKEK